MNTDKILQCLNYLEEKHQKTFDDIYDARVTRQLHSEQKQHLIERNRKTDNKLIIQC